MTKSIQQIKQELDNTKSAVAEIAVELQDRYRNYLDLLSQTAKQQLILGSYHICTQFYPQSFLDLSLSDKQDLQQSLRNLSNNIRPELLGIIDQHELEPEPSELNLMAELIKNLPKAKVKGKLSESNEVGNKENESELDLELVKAELAKIELIEIEDLDETDEPNNYEELNDSEEEKDNSKDNSIESTLSASNNNVEIEFDNPQHLLLWHRQIERKIKKILDQISKKANKSLQNSHIIPNRIPAKIIDIAMQTDGSKGGRQKQKLPKAPNIMHLAVETESGKKNLASNLSQISLLRMRLAEIEFNDPVLNAHKSQIRGLLNKINKLNSQYNNTEKKLAVAEAQAAWRSSWYEE